MDRQKLTEDERLLLFSPVGTGYASLEMPVAQQAAPESKTTAAEQAVAAFHSQWTHQLQQVWEGLTASKIQVRLRDQTLASYAEFVFDQRLPTCCAVLRSEAPAFEMYCSMEPEVLFAMLDRLSGVRDGGLLPSRPLTEIEKCLAKLLIDQAFGTYGELWKQTLALELSVDRITHNVQQMNGMWGSEPAYLARYDVACGAAFGRFEVCLPWDATRFVREHPSPH